MQFEQEAGWKLYPLAGETGQAYMGTKDEQKLFLKKNTSPFLAALSIEGVSPKLVWTRRMGNGDVLTAQEWCSGRTLDRVEMSMDRVAKKLHHVHQSQTLKKMLVRVDGSFLLPKDLLKQFFVGLSDDLRHHPTINQAIAYLKDHNHQVPRDDMVVCHGDASHKNWLLSDLGDLFLVDWDSVILADPAYDVGQYLARYHRNIDKSQWLANYSPDISQNFYERLYWYQLMTSLLDIRRAYDKQRYADMNSVIENLDEIMNDK